MKIYFFVGKLTTAEINSIEEDFELLIKNGDVDYDFPPLLAFLRKIIPGFEEVDNKKKKEVKRK